MRVTVDIYSGIPNPEFVLDAEETARVRAVLASLPAGIAPHAPPPPPLGYRGFVVHDDAPGEAPAEIRVFGSRVTVHDHGDATTTTGAERQDRAGELERLLGEAARRHLGPAALPYESIAINTVRRTGRQEP